MLLKHKRHRADDLTHWERMEAVDATHSKLASYHLHVERAVAAVRAFASVGPCYAGTSWGKDSTVLAHLTHLHAPEVPLVWVRVEPLVNPDCYAVRDAFLAAHPSVRYEEIQVRARRGQDDWHASGTLEAGFAEAQTRHSARYLSGIRASESAGRKRRAVRWGEATPNTCAPLAWWSGADVFAYLYANNLPVHPAYACTMGGLLDRERLRVASLGGQRGTGHGRAEWERAYYRAEIAAIQRAACGG